jgi:iron complex transport system substrate-binding protein
LKRTLAIALIWILVLAGCAPSSTALPSAEMEKEHSPTAIESSTPPQDNGLRIITDATGRQVEIPQVVQSIVCVNVGTLRFTTYMQATDLVIGVEQNEIEPRITKPFSYINNPLFSTLPVMGDNGTTYDEEIIKLNPDVVMAAVDKDTADNLQNKLGIPVVTIPLIDNMFDSKCYQTLALMGEVYGRQERANELIAYIKGLEEDLTRRTKDIPEEEKPTVYAGGISFKGAHGFDGTEANYSPFVAIGAKNLADLTGQTGAFNIDLEQVLQWDPDIIFLDFNGMALINEDYAANPDYYNSLTAIKEGRLYSQISFRTNAVNAELALADAYYAGKVIFPQQFADVDPAAKADEIFEMMLGTKFYDTLKEHGYEFKEMKLGE